MDLNERRAVLLKPGDLLIIGNLGKQTGGDHHQSLMVALSELRESLELAGIVMFEEDVDMASIDASEVEALMERQRERKARRSLQSCGAGVGGGEVCMRTPGHDGDHDPDSTEVIRG